MDDKRLLGEPPPGVAADKHHEGDQQEPLLGESAAAKAPRKSSVATLDPADAGRLTCWQAVTMLMIYVGYMAYTLNRNSLSPILPMLKDDPDVAFNNNDAGTVLAVASASYALGKFFLGFAVDIVGGKWVFTLCLLLSGAGSAFLTTFSSVRGFLLPVFLVRFFGAGGWPSISYLIRRWFSKKAYGRAWGAAGTASRLGSVVAALLFGFLITHEHMTWRQILFVAACGTAGMSVVQLLLLRDSPQAAGLRMDQSVLLARAVARQREEIMHLGDGARGGQGEQQQEKAARQERQLLALEAARGSHDAAAAPVGGRRSSGCCRSCCGICACPCNCSCGMCVEIGRSLKLMLCEPRFYAVTLSMLFVYGVMEFEQFATLWLTQVFLLESGLAATVSSAFSGGVGLSVLLFGLLTDKSSKLAGSVWVLGMWLGGMCIVGLMIHMSSELPTVPVYYLALSLFALGFSLGPAGYIPNNVFATQLGGQSSSGAVAGMMDSLSFVGPILFDKTAGYLLQHYGFEYVFCLMLCMGALAFVGLVVFYCLEAGHRRRKKESKII